ncbi:CbiQ family ECF transporter T component [Aquipuribacter nitratireducens]|uniref:CbiQ family ECF transporter T component n=1 Tax=Aquipuribacter nitratireducens TaxID=650104 RepID=A0ABW0GJE2_9MICO
MRRPALVPAHRPGTTWLHRAPAGAKLAVLAVVAVVVVVVVTARSGDVALLLGAAVLVMAVLGHVAVRTPRRVWGGLVVRLAPVLVVLGVYQVVLGSPWRGAEVVLDLLGLVLLAGLVTVTTPTDRLLDTITSLVAPLQHLPRLGPHLHPDRVALTLALAVRSVDVLWDVAVQARDAARARGRSRDVRALVTPTVVRAVGHARATGDALAARGLVD